MWYIDDKRQKQQYGKLLSTYRLGEVRDVPTLLKFLISSINLFPLNISRFQGEYFWQRSNVVAIFYWNLFFVDAFSKIGYTKVSLFRQACHALRGN